MEWRVEGCETVSRNFGDLEKGEAREGYVEKRKYRARDLLIFSYRYVIYI